MNRPLDIKSRPQLALQSYLDALLQDATEEEQLPEPPVQVAPPVPPVMSPASSEVLDEFQAAVLEEQARDAQVQHQAALPRWQTIRNRLIGKVRTAVERTFSQLKGRYGLERMRYRGLRANAFHLDLVLIAFNLRTATRT